MDLAQRIAASAAPHPESIPRRCVIAASGGGDSTALVGALCESGLIERAESVIAHFDHRLRGPDQAQLERAAVEELAARFGLPLVVGSWADPVQGEQAARRARYRFLAEAARQAGATTVAVGHTSDDQVETLLLRMARGTGLHGLAGMSTDAAWPLGGEPSRLWRPLLDVSRAETRAYCRERGLQYVDDASNDDRRYARNAVRLDVLPALEQIEPGVRASLLQLAREARAATAMIERDAERAIIEEQAGEVKLSRAMLRGMSSDVAATAFRLALTRLLGTARDFERRHYVIAVAAAGARTGSTFELPRNVRVTVDHDALLITEGSPVAAGISHTLEAPLPYTAVVGGWRLDVRAAATGVPLPADACVRGRRPGDRIRPLGLRGTRKLQDFYVDRHVPRRLRDAAPVIAAGSMVLWTPFGRCEEAPGAEASYAIEATPLPA